MLRLQPERPLHPEKQEAGMSQCLVAEGIVVGTDREVASGTGVIAEVTGGVVCATGVAEVADRAV